jgi:lipid-binding SYLF domain-containing protein
MKGTFEGEIMRKSILVVLILMLALPAFAGSKETERISESYNVMKEILGIPDGIPKDLVKKAACVVVFPSVKKAAFGVGGSYGRGVITCRSGKDLTGGFSAPAMMALEGLSVGFQIGGQATDFVILVMNDAGAKSIMDSKVKLGADASIAAGPKGRTAEAATDVVMQAEMLSYSRSRGAFAGVSLAGSTLRSDGGANKDVYGKELTARQIVRDGAVTATPEGKRLVALLNHVSPAPAKKK